MSDREDYKKRFAIRRTTAGAIGGLIVIGWTYTTLRDWWTGSGFFGPLLFHGAFSAAGLGVVYWLFWLIDSNDPDPDPVAAKREAEERAAERTKIAADNAVKKAETKQVRDALRAETNVRKAEETAKRNAERAAEQAVFDKQAGELAAALLVQQIEHKRSNRITELLILSETNPNKALKLANREGIDLAAEAQNRLASGVAAIGFALGAGAQAGAEVVKEMVRKR